MDTVIQLGDFAFQGLEVPEKINFGGEQLIVKHQLIGGVRILDAMGQDDSDISWSGLMTGTNALARAQTLNQIRASGQKISLKWFNLNYTVIIKSFVADTEKFFQVAYTITLMVVEDNTTPATAQNLIGFNEAIKDDMATVDRITAGLSIPSITDAVLNVNKKVAAVPTFNGADDTTTAPVKSAIDEAIAAVKKAINGYSQSIFGVNAF